MLHPNTAMKVSSGLEKSVCVWGGDCGKSIFMMHHTKSVHEILKKKKVNELQSGIAFLRVESTAKQSVSAQVSVNSLLTQANICYRPIEPYFQIARLQCLWYRKTSK